MTNNKIIYSNNEYKSYLNIMVFLLIYNNLIIVIRCKVG